MPSKKASGVDRVRINGIKVRTKPLASFKCRHCSAPASHSSCGPATPSARTERSSGWVQSHRAAEIRRLQTALDIGQVSSCGANISKFTARTRLSAFNPPSPAREGRQNSKKFDSVTPSRMTTLTTAEGGASCWTISALTFCSVRLKGRATLTKKPSLGQAAGRTGSCQATGRPTLRSV